MKVVGDGERHPINLDDPVPHFCAPGIRQGVIRHIATPSVLGSGVIALLACRNELRVEKSTRYWPAKFPIDSEQSDLSLLLELCLIVIWSLSG